MVFFSCIPNPIFFSCNVLCYCSGSWRVDNLKNNFTQLPHIFNKLTILLNNRRYFPIDPLFDHRNGNFPNNIASSSEMRVDLTFCQRFDTLSMNFSTFDTCSISHSKNCGNIFLKVKYCKNRYWKNKIHVVCCKDTP